MCVDFFLGWLAWFCHGYGYVPLPCAFTCVLGAGCWLQCVDESILVLDPQSMYIPHTLDTLLCQDWDRFCLVAGFLDVVMIFFIHIDHIYVL